MPKAVRAWTMRGVVGRGQPPGAGGVYRSGPRPRHPPVRARDFPARSDRADDIVSERGQGEVREERTSGGAWALPGALFPLGDAIRVERSVRARRPDVRAERPAFREPELAHWRPLLEASPTLGTLVDAIHDEARARTASAAAAAHTALATATVLAGVLVVAFGIVTLLRGALPDAGHELMPGGHDHGAMHHEHGAAHVDGGAPVADPVPAHPPGHVH